MADIVYCKTLASVISGSCAGIIGLTGIAGFTFYFMSAQLLWLMILYKAGYDFQQKKILFNNGFFENLFTYVLFWTFLYGMVHVY